MREMKIITLLTNVYNNENIPTHIVFHNIEYVWNPETKEYMGQDGKSIGTRWDLQKRTDDVVEYFDVNVAPITKLSLTDSEGKKRVPSEIDIVNKINEIIEYLK